VLRQHLRSVPITVGALLALAALLFYPPVERALGGIFALSADGATVAKYPDWLRRRSRKDNWGYVDYSHIPACLEQAIVSVEDKRFPLHGGIDPIALLRVLIEDAENDHLDHGGSTITLQLARMILHIPRRQPSAFAEVASQFRIVRAALMVEHDFSKQKILELYLNSVYLGRGATGVRAAAEAYFNVTLQRLNKAPCIYIAGLPKAPARFGADPSGEQAMARYRHVIATMERNGYLTKEQDVALDDEQLFSRLPER
jgi:membrane peptidoglycan carboxypeptidase